MRISGGLARGITLKVPKGDAVRPATDGLRQAVFSSLGGRVVGARFLDLFAGSGAYGLEAVSRGAERGVWVERNPRALECLRANLEAVCRSMGRTLEGLQVLPGDAASVPWAESAGPDLVFVDPPYPMISDVGPRVLRRLAELDGGGGDPLVVFEMPGEILLEAPGWREVKRLGKGARQPTVAFFSRGSSDPR